MSMKPEIKAKWVEALRSGKYTQGREQLCTPDGKMCCLGVLTDLYIKETGEGAWCDPGKAEYSSNTDVSIQSPYLPHPVCHWAGLDNHIDFNPQFINVLRRDSVEGDTHSHMELSAVSVNDLYELTFPQIADFVECFL